MGMHFLCRNTVSIRKYHFHLAIQIPFGETVPIWKCSRILIIRIARENNRDSNYWSLQFIEFRINKSGISKFWFKKRFSEFKFLKYHSCEIEICHLCSKFQLQPTGFSWNSSGVCEFRFYIVVSLLTSILYNYF